MVAAGLQSCHTDQSPSCENSPGQTGERLGMKQAPWGLGRRTSFEPRELPGNLCCYPAPFITTSLLLILTQDRAEGLDSRSAKPRPPCPRPTLHPFWGWGPPGNPRLHSYCSSAGYLGLWVAGMHPLLSHLPWSRSLDRRHLFQGQGSSGKLRTCLLASQPRKCWHPCLTASQAGSLPAR